MPVYEERIWLHADKRPCFLQNNSDAPKTLVAPHWHEGYEILYIRRGWGEQRINAQVLPFHLGEIVVICPGDIHATEALAPKGCEIDVVHCSEDLLDAYESERAARKPACRFTSTAKSSACAARRRSCRTDRRALPKSRTGSGTAAQAASSARSSAHTA